MINHERIQCVHIIIMHFELHKQISIPVDDMQLLDDV